MSLWNVCEERKASQIHQRQRGKQVMGGKNNDWQDTDQESGTQKRQKGPKKEVNKFSSLPTRVKHGLLKPTTNDQWAGANR